MITDSPFQFEYELYAPAQHNFMVQWYLQNPVHAAYTSHDLLHKKIALLLWAPLLLQKHILLSLVKQDYISDNLFVPNHLQYYILA